MHPSKSTTHISLAMAYSLIRVDLHPVQKRGHSNATLPPLSMTFSALRMYSSTIRLEISLSPPSLSLYASPCLAMFTYCQVLHGRQGSAPHISQSPSSTMASSSRLLSGSRMSYVVLSTLIIFTPWRRRPVTSETVGHKQSL